MKRIGGHVWIFGFAVIALLWPLTHQINIQSGEDRPVVSEPTAPVVPPAESPSIDKLINFCMDPRHSDSVVCTARNPNDEVRDAFTVSPRYPAPNGRTVTQSRTEQVRTDQRVASRPAPRTTATPSTRPTPIRLPEVPEIEVPRVEVPKVEIPEIPEVPEVPKVEKLTDDVVEKLTDGVRATSTE